jgi:hypothetical protein
MNANLSTAALIILAERDDLTPYMVIAITAEIRVRREALEAAARRVALADYWAGSVSASVAADYRSGNVRTIDAG